MNEVKRFIFLLAGTHESKYTDVKPSECTADYKTCSASASNPTAQCMCDSFGVTGEAHCGCEKGGFVVRKSRSRYGCQGRFI